MDTHLLSRRHLMLGLVLLPHITDLQARAAASGNPSEATGDASEGLSHSAESIHQAVTFAAPPYDLYDALTSAAKFDAVTRLSDAATLLTAPHAKPTAISAQPGGTFVLFGGYITGRHLEMRPGERLVQAWRAASWPAGSFSIVDFSLAPVAAGCRLTFDHRGFPEGQGANLAYGWRVHYWEPLTKFLRER